MEYVKMEDYLASPDTVLQDHDTYRDFGRSEKQLKKDLKRTRKLLGDFQNVLYAHDRYSVLICLQGMDTAGKDSLIREVFKDFNVRGVEYIVLRCPPPWNWIMIIYGGTILNYRHGESSVSSIAHTMKTYW